MSDYARRRGRRDNGLEAAFYVPVADVDPRIGEHLLDVLWAAGVPAYLEPSTDVQPTRALTVPSPPVDRLWVDRERHVAARSIVAAELPAGTDTEEERAWRALVEEFHREPRGPRPWPVAEDLPPPADPPRPSSPSFLDTEEHFEPPPPPPIPRPSRYALLALAILAFGALLLVAPQVLGLSGDGVFAVSVLAIASGVGLLVWRLKEDRDDDGPDDGAVV